MWRTTAYDVRYDPRSHPPSRRHRAPPPYGRDRMPARRLLPPLALGLAAACGRGADSTGAATTTSTLPAGPGVHDHTPHHGGVVGMAGDLHLEALAAPDGLGGGLHSRLWRRPLPAACATGTVKTALPHRHTG